MSEGENEAFKKSLAWEGRRRAEYCYCRDRTSGEWRKVEEVIHEVSNNSTCGVYQTCKDSRVLLGVHTIKATKSRQALEPTAEYKPELQC